MNRRILALALVITGLAVAAAVVAATRDDTRPDPTAHVREAVERTVEEETAAIALSVRIENLPPEIGEVDVTGEGEVRLGDGATDLTLRISRGLAEFAGGEAGDVRLVDDGEAAFVKPPGEDLWRPVAPEARRAAEGSFDLLVGTDPTAGLDFVRTALVDADVDGTNDVRGEPATRFEVTLDPEEARTDEPAAAIGRLLDELGFDDVFAYIWIDGDGRVVRVRYDADLARITGGGPFGAGGRFVTEFELFDFGSPLDIELPPPSDRATTQVEARELERLLGGLGL